MIKKNCTKNKKFESKNWKFEIRIEFLIFLKVKLRVAGDEECGRGKPICDKMMLLYTILQF